jgi:hypothetical protein
VTDPLCQRCKRIKARNFIDAAAGRCPLEWARGDLDAELDCAWHVDVAAAPEDDSGVATISDDRALTIAWIRSLVMAQTETGQRPARRAALALLDQLEAS